LNENPLKDVKFSVSDEEYVGQTSPLRGVRGYILICWNMMLCASMIDA